MSLVCSYLYKKMLTEDVTIEMSGKNKFYMTIPQVVYHNDKHHAFNMIVEFKIFRGKLKMVLKDVKEAN